MDCPVCGFENLTGAEVCDNCGADLTFTGRPQPTLSFHGRLLGENGVTEADLLVHDEQAEEPYLALMLSRMFWPAFPVPVGVFRAAARPTHDNLITEQIQGAIARSGAGNLEAVLHGGETWTAE